jgi:phage terminase large subunit-like protein
LSALVETVCDALADLPPELAVEYAAAWLDELSPLELAALYHDWDRTWARAKQIIPRGAWRSWGFLCGRRFGKTRAVAEFVNREAESGRAMRIALIAQNEDKAIEVQVEGDSGLIETAPPWFKPSFEKGRVIWPNGAQAFIFTPEKPGNIRGPGVHMAWATELQSWPVATRGEAWRNLQIMCSLGYAKTVWDCSPKKRHPILRDNLRRAELEPDKHHVVRGEIRENADNLGEGVIEDLEHEIGGTQAGDEELRGIYFDEAEGAAWRQEWIDDHRRNAPLQLKRRIIAIDPAISERAGTDPTGIVELGLGLDEQVFVFADHTGRHAPEAWGELVLDAYLAGKCDCVLVERNRGGDLVVALLRACARERGIEVEVLDLKATTRHTPSVVYVKEIVGRTSKFSRAEPAATVYERGRASHVIGADLGDLEDEMTTFVPEPGADSPNRLDALVHGIWELEGFFVRPPDARAGFKGIGKLAEQLAPQASSPSARELVEPAAAPKPGDNAIAALLRGGRRDLL